jgi:IS30 family transposase
MERERLVRWLTEGLSLERIGLMTGKDPSTVGYWVRKHGLKAVNSGRHAPKGGISREALETLIESDATIRGMSDALAVSDSTVVHWLRRHGLKTKRAQRRSQRPAAGPLPRIVLLTCAHHGDTEHVLEGRGYYRCKRCRRK